THHRAGVPMRLTIFGATGGTGRQLVEQALDAGHEVTAVLRDVSRLPVEHQRLSRIRADVLDPGDIEPAIEASDAVFSALGVRPGGQFVPVCAPGVVSIIKAMQAAGVRRLVCVSAAPIPDHDPGDRLLYRLTVKKVLRAVLRKGYADL